MAMILVSHDMGVVAETCDDVAVMYAGKIVEVAKTKVLFETPQHPYTVGLMSSIPSIEEKQAHLIPIPGQPPNLARLGPGCPFAERCPHASADCWETPVALRRVAADHFTACLHPERM